jgi:hypothetical protein
MATKVSLRRKRISKGREALYLDFYPPISNTNTGKPTRREFLGLYVLMSKKEQKAVIDKLKDTIKKRALDGKDCTAQQNELNERELLQAIQRAYCKKQTGLCRDHENW